MTWAEFGCLSDDEKRQALRQEIGRGTPLKRFANSMGVCAESVYLEARRLGIKQARSFGGANICFSCKRACGGCSWSEINPKTGKPRFEPVPSWTATKCRLLVGKGQYTATYHITACPLFEPDEKRDAAGGELDEAELRILMAHWRRTGK